MDYESNGQIRDRVIKGAAIVGLLYALKSFVPDVDLSGMDQKKQAPKNKAKPTRQIASDIKDTIIEEVQVAKPRVRSS
jgi:hypothetical protein